MPKLQAFHNNKAIKETYLARAINYSSLSRHAGVCIKTILHPNWEVAWDERPGGFNFYEWYEEELGIDLRLAKIKYTIFEHLDFIDSKKWPAQFISAISVGSDLSMIWPTFAQWLLVDPNYGVIKYATRDEDRHRIETTASQLAEGKFDEKRQGWRRHEDLLKEAKSVDSPSSWALVVTNCIWTASNGINRDAEANWANEACTSWVEAAISSAPSNHLTPQRAYKAMANRLLELLTSAAPETHPVS